MRPTRAASVVVACAWLVAGGRPAASAAVNKVQVASVEIGRSLGTPGLAVRITLIGGEALEFRAGDDDAESLLRMTDLFAAHRARMFAEVDGKVVRALQVAVP